MQEPQPWVASTYGRLADQLAGSGAEWDAPSLCEGWLVRHVVAHVTMPVRLTREQFASEMAAAAGDFGVLSDAVAARDASLPTDDLLAQLRSPELHAWQPPGGGAAGADRPPAGRGDPGTARRRPGGVDQLPAPVAGGHPTRTGPVRLTASEAARGGVNTAIRASPALSRR